MYLSSLRSKKLDRLLSALDLTPRTDTTITAPAALQSELATTRARGYATDNQEFMDGMAAIAVAIKDQSNRFLTTLSIHAPIQRHSIESLTKNLSALQEAARKLEVLAQD